MADPPRGPVVRRRDRDKAARSVAGRSRHGERHAGRRDADGPDAGCAGLVAEPERSGQEAVGRFEGIECRDRREALQEGVGVDGLLGQAPASGFVPPSASEGQVEVSGERCGAVPPPGAPGQGGAGQGAASQGDQFGQAVGRARRRGVVPTRLGVTGAEISGLGGQSEPPPGHHVVGVDEAPAITHVAAEVEGGNLHPVGPVTEVGVGDPPQAFAGLDGDGMDGRGRRRRRRRRRRCGLRGGRNDRGRGASGGAGARRQHQGSAGRGQGQHTHGDACGDPVERRHDTDRPHLAPADVQRHPADEL